LHVFDAALVYISTCAKNAMQLAAPYALDERAIPASVLVIDNLLQPCSMCIEASCYALHFFKMQEEGDVRDDLLWLRAGQNIRPSTRIPERVVISSCGVRLRSNLREAAFRFLSNDSPSVLDKLPGSFSHCPTFLNLPLVADRLFAIAFDPQLAHGEILPVISFMIAVAATSSTDYRRDEPQDDPSAITAEVACTAASVLACGRRCLEERLVTHPNELEAGGSVSRGDALLSQSRRFPAARHGVLVWLKQCLVDPEWLSMRLSRFTPTLICILKVYATYPRSQRDVFEVLKLVVEAPRRAISADSGAKCDQSARSPNVQEKYELTDARKAALFALVDLAIAWHGAPEVLYFVENSKSIDASQLRHVVVRLSRKTLPPYSSRFGHAVATLLSCFKAKQIWYSETYSHEDRQLIRMLSSQIATTLRGRTIIHY